MIKSFNDFCMNENTAVHKYSCLMLDCNDLIEDVKAIHSKIDKDDVYGGEEGLGLEDEPHITVLYGIHEPSAQIVKDHMDMSPVTYKLDGLSIFENDKYDVLKVSVTSPRLNELNKQAKKLKYTSNFPDYQPHLTVAYLKSGTGKKFTDIDSPMFKKELSSNRFIFSNKDNEKTNFKV